MAENMLTKEKLCLTQKALSGWNKWFGVCITSLFVVSAVRVDFTVYTITSACIFSQLYSIHFLRFCQGEFDNQVSLGGDNFILVTLSFGGDWAKIRC